MANDYKDVILKQEAIEKKAKEQARKNRQKAKQARLEINLKRYQQFVNSFDDLANDIRSKSFSVNLNNPDGSQVSKKCIKIEDVSSLINSLINEYITDDMKDNKSNKKTGTGKSK